MVERAIPTTEHRRESLDYFAVLLGGFDVGKAELGVALWSTAVSLNRAYDLHVQRYGLTPARFAVLLTLLAAPDLCCTPSAIAQRIKVSRPTVTGIIDGLVKLGLVTRCSDASDRRNQPVALTKKGQKLGNRAAGDHFPRLASVIGAFSEAERGLMREALGLMARFEKTIVQGEVP